jgi:hypothetical protein
MESAVLFIFCTCRSGTMKHSSRHFVEQCLYLLALHLCNSAGPVKYCGTKRFCARLTYLLGSTIGATGDNKICRKIRLYNVWSQASVAVYVRPSFFWNVKQRGSIVIYRRFGTTYLVSFSRVDLTRNLPLKIRLDRLFRNVGNCQSTLSNTPEK